MTEPTLEELEKFRREWRAEVNARSKRPQDGSSSQQNARRTSDSRPERPINRPPIRHPTADIKQDDSEAEEAGGNSSAPFDRTDGLKYSTFGDGEPTSSARKEPETALEHFERAVEKEGEGSLGDSLAHYRKAYKLDDRVDQVYKQKHHAAAWTSKPTNTNPSNAPVTVPSTAHHSLEEPEPKPLTFPEMIQSFAEFPITGRDPIIQGDRPPPCPIKKLPVEVLLELLQHVAIRDPAIYVRLALVCKKLTYHVMTDNNIWKRVALGSEFGLGSQRYVFNTDLQGRPVVFSTLEEDGLEEEDGDEQSSWAPLTEMSFPKDTVWQDIFHFHPRIRFSGVYISTVNYTRPGGASATISTWSNHIHIVTYYRYLRFFRDGTCISLLTTNKPTDVIHHLTAENLTFARTGKRDAAGTVANLTPAGSSANAAGQPGPSTRDVMKHALRGRWRLCHPNLESPITQPDEAGTPSPHPSRPKSIMSAGDLHIETEGAGPRYTYTMHLALKSAGSAKTRQNTKNNKLVWQGFWSCNKLTNDWAEFQLKHDKPFFFSTVRSFGLGL